jgi:hypothetical protein
MDLRSRLSLTISIVLSVLGLALTASGYQNRALGLVLFGLAAVSLLVGFWPWLRRVRLRSLLWLPPEDGSEGPVPAPEVSRADRQQLLTLAQHGFGLYRRALRAEDVEGWKQDYLSWRNESAARFLQERFPEVDESRFKKPTKQVPPADGVGPTIDDAHLQIKREFKRDLETLEEIIHRHTPPGLPKPWKLPWSA